MAEGTQQADDEAAVVASLDRQGLSVIRVEAETETDSLGGGFLSRFTRLDKREVILFIRQLATLLRTGTPMTRALATSCDQATDKKFKVMLRDISRMVQEGNSLSDAMSRYPEAFSELYVSMVRVGETGGILDSTMTQLAQLLGRDEKVRTNMKNASAYPIFVLGIGFISVIIVITAILPRIINTIFILLVGQNHLT